jgi:hypothetical protein
MMKDRNLSDHYKVLEVSENATAAEIKAAYRQQMRIHHPDINPDDIEAHSKAVAINLAFEILNNDRTRSDYDKIRSYKRGSRCGTSDTSQQREYAETRARYQESEYAARERVKKWIYESLSIRPTKRHKWYTPQGNGTKLDDLVTKIDCRLGDKVWGYRIRNGVTPVSADRMMYPIKIVLDPSKCVFKENHPDWVKDYYHGLFRAGTKEDEEHNIRIAYNWLGDILKEVTYSHQINYHRPCRWYYKGRQLLTMSFAVVLP